MSMCIRRCAISSFGCHSLVCLTKAALLVTLMPCKVPYSLAHGLLVSAPDNATSSPASAVGDRA